MKDKRRYRKGKTYEEIFGKEKKKQLLKKQKMFMLDRKAESAMVDYNKKGYTFICTEVGRNKEESFMNLYKRVNLLDKRINYLKECKNQIKES